MSLESQAARYIGVAGGPGVQPPGETGAEMNDGVEFGKVAVKPRLG